MIFRKEQKVIDLILKHLSTAEECLKIALETIEIYLKGDISQAKSLAIKVDSIETQNDQIRYTISSSLNLMPDISQTLQTSVV